MKQYIKTFCHRGLIGMGFGPVVMAIIFICLYASGVAKVITVPAMVKGILSISVMAFIAAGLPVLYLIERLPLMSAILLHAVGLYLDYLILYLFNDWIVKDLTAISIFTAVFFAGFALVWGVIYFINAFSTKKLNQNLPKA